ncbi:MAG: restriction endonuclease subunit S [Bacteroidales bacterium]|nr:restriction endonuclease subunit S [Bacteroidales bacterium]
MKKGWEKYTLMDICNVTTGKHDANHAEINGKYRFYTCSSQYVYCNTKRYEGECIILPGNGINVGESYYYNGEFDAYQRTYVIDKIDKRIIPMYLFYHLQNNWKSEGVAKQYGSATNYIKIGNFKDYIVKMPQSLSEQQSIVDYLDSAFAKIDAMKANAEKALNEAKALFQASLKEMLEPKEGWEEKKLKDFATEFYRGSGVKKDQVTEKGVSCVRYGEIYTKYNYHFNKCDSYTLAEYVSSPKYFENGDILFAITGESVEEIGKSIAYTGNEKCIAGGDIVVMKHTYEPRYISYALSTPSAVKQKGRGKTKLKVVHTNIPSLEEIIIPIAPMNDQIRIADTLDSIKSKVDRLQANYDKISQECDALKQAILRQVFE